MNNWYKVIANEDKLREFIDWLPELEPTEMFYVSLFARNKYTNKNIGADKQQLKRFTSNKHMLFQKIKQLETPFGGYLKSGEIIPPESLAVYIMPNPRSMTKAASKSLIELAKRITEPYNGYNPHQLVMSEIQKSPSRKIFFDFDFDGVELSTLKQICGGIINKDACSFLQTRGGVHLLVETKKINNEFKKSWFDDISKLPGLDKDKGDKLIPVPGCYQGGFVPNLN